MTGMGNTLSVDGTIRASQATQEGECVTLGTGAKIPAEMLPEGASGSGLTLQSTRRITRTADFLLAIRDNSKSDMDPSARPRFAVYMGTLETTDDVHLNVSLFMPLTSCSSLGDNTISATGTIYTSMPVTVVGLRYVDSNQLSYCYVSPENVISTASFKAGAKSADLIELMYGLPSGGGEPDLLICRLAEAVA